MSPAASGAPPPSGEQVELAYGDQRAVVVEVGGGLRTYSAEGRALLDGYGLEERCRSARGQLLLPWPNRLESGRYEFDGTSHQLPLTEPSASNAIHGLVRWVSWRVCEREPHRAVLEHVLHPQPGYPFRLELSAEYSLGESGLTVRITARNGGAAPCPYGAGQHPYLTLGTPLVDALELELPARRVLAPDGWAEVAGSDYDFTSPRPVGSTRLDHPFTDLERARDGRAHVRVRDRVNGARAALWVDESFPYVMLFTGDDLPDVGRRSIAVEPMTCPPGAFRTGESLRRLEPGETATSTWGIVPGG